MFAMIISSMERSKIIHHRPALGGVAFPFTLDNPVYQALQHLRWIRLERWLLNRYPDAEQIVTPSAGPIWNVKESQAFLRARGYTKGHPGTFAKFLK
jgi:hypothetical protein